ncbi:MAG TPA: DUF4340 domain-containing protein [Candidatus Limnocylindrales bacterium]|nr:DUF4340 domain-containing protein [Candidatus Limnocylindrales bacterium]
MSFVRTLIFALVAVALGAYIYLYETPKAEKEAKGEGVVEFDAAKASRVRLSYPDDSTIELEKDGGQWKLVAPIAAPADNNAVDRFLEGVRDTRIERRLKKEEVESLAAYGLDKPTGTQGRLEITLEDGTTVPPVIMGNTTPVDHFAFGRVEGSDDVLVTPLLIHTSIKKTPFDFRKKRLFDVQPDQIGRISIHKGADRIELERSGEKNWNLILPKNDAADSQAAESIAGAFDTIEALAYFDGPGVNLDSLGLSEPTLTVTAHLAGGEQVGFKLGKEAADQPAGFYLQRSSDGQVAKVADWVAQKFGPSLDDLRSRALTACKPDDVVKITFTQGQDSYSLLREAAGKAWTMEPAPQEGHTVKQRIVDNLLRGLVDMKGDKIAGDAAGDADKARFGLDAPQARVELATKTGVCGVITAAKAPEAKAEAAEGAAATAGTKDASAPADAADPAAATEDEALAQALGRAAPPPKPAAPAPQYYLQGRDRSAVVTAGAHLFSRLAMKRDELVDAPPEPAPAKQDAGD